MQRLLLQKRMPMLSVADAVMKLPGVVTHVDLFDRLPTPYGLVRFGVAPDHQEV